MAERTTIVFPEDLKDRVRLSGVKDLSAYLRRLAEEDLRKQAGTEAGAVEELEGQQARLKELEAAYDDGKAKGLF